MIAWNSASSSANDVRIRHAVRGWRRADLAAGLDAVAVLQAHVEHGDVGVEGVDPADGLGLGARLADDLDVALGLEQVAQAPPDDLVVVEQEHGDSLGFGHTRSSRSDGGADVPGRRDHEHGMVGVVGQLRGCS